MSLYRSVGEEAEKYGISIHSILQKPRPLLPVASNEGNNVINFVIITDMMTLSKVKDFTSAMTALSFVKGEPLFMPMI
jgi:hypothetical protein